jgi:hypothetical protein
LESQDSTWSDQARERTQNRSRIGKKHQDVAADGSIKGSVARDFGRIGLRKSHVAQARLSHASIGSGNRPRVALDSNDLTCRTNEPGCYQGHVPNAGTEIQDTVNWTDASLAEESLGVSSEPPSLPNKPLVFHVGAAESILRSGIILCHFGGAYYHASN